MTEKLRIQLLNENAKAPLRATENSAGYDLFSSENTLVCAKDKKIVKTGISIAVPEGHYGRVAPRSGLAVKNFIDVGAGVIDSDYRGEVGVVLFNFSDINFEIKKGDRIAQLIIEKISNPEILVVESLDNTDRGDCGFGSTGK